MDEDDSRRQGRAAMVGGLVGLGVVAVVIVLIAISQESTTPLFGLLALLGGAVALLVALRSAGGRDTR